MDLEMSVMSNIMEVSKKNSTHLGNSFFFTERGDRLREWFSFSISFSRLTLH
jgi:hypothetical protein